VLTERVEHRVGDATLLEHETIGVGEHGPLDGRVTAGDRPGADRLDLLLAEPDVARRLAVLGEHELAAHGVAGAQLTQLAQLR